MSKIDRVPRRGQGVRLDTRFKLIKRKFGKSNYLRRLKYSIY